jgi:hypothetical protein
MNRYKNYPQFAADHIANQVWDGSVKDDSGADLSDVKLRELLTLDPSVVSRFGEPLEEMVRTPTDDFPGSDTLRSIAGVDPYSSVYRDAMEAYFKQAFDEAAAAGRTGPDAVRGGNVHGAMMESDLLEQAALDKFRTITGLQMGQAGVSTEAARVLDTLTQGRNEAVRSSIALGLDDYFKRMGVTHSGLSELHNRQRTRAGTSIALGQALGSDATYTDDNFFGAGNQAASTHNIGGGLQCCFIFLQALNGKLPWFVRVARNVMGTDDTRRGYIRMSKWLVPLMQRSPFMQAAVNGVMIKPMLRYGAWVFKADEAKPSGRFFRPVQVFWFKVWEMLGRS